MRLFDFFESKYRPQRLLGRSPNTSRLYGISIRNFGRTLEREPLMADLTDDNVILHMQSMLDLGRAPATANKDRAQILTLWRHAHRLGLVNAYPNVPQLVEPQRTPDAWLPEQLAALFAAVDRQEGYFASVPRSLWWRALLMTCLDTGERIGAIRQARWSWLSGLWLTVPAEARKGRRRDRAYRLEPATVGHLEAIRLVSTREPFPWPYCGDYIWTLYGKLLDEAGLPSGRRDKFHRLRRTTASAVHAAGLDAQEALDHQFRRTTARYIDPRFKQDRQPCDVLADIFEGLGG